jgi:hypothetical protein
MRRFTARFRHQCRNREQGDRQRGVQRDHAHEPRTTQVQEPGWSRIVVHDDLIAERTTSAIATVPMAKPANMSASNTT